MCVCLHCVCVHCVCVCVCGCVCVCACTHCFRVQEDLEQLHHQNKHLTDRLKELGISVEQFTDTEKLIMKIGSGSVKSLGKSGDSISASDGLLQPSISCDSLSTDGAKGEG